MRRQKNDDQSWDVTGRIKSLEMFTGSLKASPQGDEIEVATHAAHAAPVRVPQPRRSRIFLRSGGGHGAFAELTVTAPRPRHALD